MALKSERGWKVLLFGLLATVIIWALGNLTPILFDLFLEGEISRTSSVAFTMGLYGVISGGLISILSEKVGFLDGSDFAKGRKALAEIGGVVTAQLAETQEQRDLREIVEAKEAKMTVEEFRAMKEAEANPPPIVEQPAIVPEPTESAEQAVKVIVDAPVVEPIPEPIVEPTPEPPSE